MDSEPTIRISRLSAAHQLRTSIPISISLPSAKIKPKTWWLSPRKKPGVRSRLASYDLRTQGVLTGQDHMYGSGVHGIVYLDDLGMISILLSSNVPARWRECCRQRASTRASGTAAVSIVSGTAYLNLLVHPESTGKVDRG